MELNDQETGGKAAAGGGFGKKRILTGEQPAGKAWPRRRPWKTEEGSWGPTPSPCGPQLKDIQHAELSSRKFQGVQRRGGDAFSG